MRNTKQAVVNRTIGAWSDLALNSSLLTHKSLISVSKGTPHLVAVKVVYTLGCNWNLAHGNGPPSHRASNYLLYSPELGGHGMPERTTGDGGPHAHFSIVFTSVQL